MKKFIYCQEPEPITDPTKPPPEE